MAPVLTPATCGALLVHGGEEEGPEEEGERDENGSVAPPSRGRSSGATVRMSPNMRPKRSTFVLTKPSATTPRAMAATVKTPTAESSLTEVPSEARAVAPATGSETVSPPPSGGNPKSVATATPPNAACATPEPTNARRLSTTKNERAAEEHRERSGEERPLEERVGEELDHAPPRELRGEGERPST